MSSSRKKKPQAGVETGSFIPRGDETSSEMSSTFTIPDTGFQPRHTIVGLDGSVDLAKLNLFHAKYHVSQPNSRNL